MRRFSLKWIALLLLALAGCNDPIGPLPGGPQSGALQVGSTPSGAAVALDGVLMNVNTPYTFSSVASGSHTVRLTLDGYDAATTTVQVHAGATAQVNSQLLPSYVQPLSPQALVSDVATAFNRREPGSYTAFLAPGFTFIPSASDRAVHGLPAAYDRLSEVQFAQNFLSSGGGALEPASRVTVTLGSLQISDDTRPGHAGWKIAQLQSRCTAQFSSGGGIQFSSPIQLTLARNPDVDSNWRVVEWSESSPAKSASGALSATPLTWGQLRGAYLAQATGSLSGASLDFGK